jgi:hypothetical protein
MKTYWGSGGIAPLRSHIKLFWENLKLRDRLEQLGVERIILKWILKRIESDVEDLIHVAHDRDQ